MSDPKRYETAEQMIRGVMTGVQKARSNAVEACGGRALAAELAPGLFNEDDPLFLLTVTSRMLDNPSTLTWADAANLSYILHRDEQVLHTVSAHTVMRGMEPFPTMSECHERLLAP